MTTMEKGHWLIARRLQEAANAEKGKAAAIPQTASSAPANTWTALDMARAYGIIPRQETLDVVNRGHGVPTKEIIEQAVDGAFEKPKPEIPPTRLSDFFARPSQPSEASAGSWSAPNFEPATDESASAWVPAPIVAPFTVPPAPGPTSLSSSTSTLQAHAPTGEWRVNGCLEELRTFAKTYKWLSAVEALNIMLYKNLNTIYWYYTEPGVQPPQTSQASVLYECEKFSYMKSYEAHLPALQCRRGTGNIYSGVSERIALSVRWIAYIESEAEHYPNLYKDSSPWSYLCPTKYSASKLKKQQICAGLLMTFQNQRALTLSEGY
ncbi:hypothetical protein DDE82_008634 [Stemphylium lycopersici]|uniref:Uncharacterized protein n=1 Tax=Stemphylium lycopersici TaxID=183478 RepID=A0A364MTV4_STELY|nr:hypothetical protein TW65_04995 [Stemphylium lycopersici]RAQ99073.1 hypothetical protein DDE82_008634 [Stemphylium lycopersici]RAR03096.1 hypothetical protein DDE83_008347 [Stemphylium lycopersici]